MTRPQYERVAISSLKFDKRNARKHDKKNIKAIKDSLTRFGQKKPIVVGADGSVVAGNGTLQAAIELGWDTIDVNKTELKGEEAIAYALADNRTAELAEWDDENLKASLAELDEAGWDLDGLGFDADDLKDLLPETGTAGLTDEDDVPEVEQNVFGVKLGDVWQLGNHRLMCGDSTDKANVEKLMNGEKADMVFTDPPYGVNYDSSWRANIVGGFPGKENSIMNDDKFPKFMHLLDAPVAYIWHAGCLSLDLLIQAKETNYEPKSQIIWKKVWSISRTHYNQVHEPCFYFVKKGSNQNWIGNTNCVTVWETKKDYRSNRDTSHPTEKPVELAENAISNHDAEIVLDLFLGSGSTLIACEKTNRTCYGMELDPHYCSVIIKRWQDFTGKEAVKL
jgi:DNA modification methylase